MKAEVIPLAVPVGDGYAITAYQVDYEGYHIVGYHESVTTKGTFGVYEREAVANFVAKGIMNGSIKPIPVETDHSYPDD